MGVESSDSVGPVEAVTGESRPWVTVADATELLARMREGDRAAAAEFMDRFGERVRRRVRRRLNRVVRRMVDSQDLVSTVSRRLDLYVRSGRLSAKTEAELWSFLFRVAENALIDKNRAFDRAKRGESPIAQLETHADLGHTPPQDCDPTGHGTLIRDCLVKVSDPTDQEILNLWLRGTPLDVIADLLGLPAPRVRKRWQRLRESLRKGIETAPIGR